MVRFVSVDSVLRGTSEIPSGQLRNNPLSAIQSARGPASPASPARQPPRPVNPRRVVDQSRVLPIRSSKVSEKLVFLPETDETDAAHWDYQEEEEEGPLRDDEEESRDQDDSETVSRVPPRKSYAERLPKARRAEKFARVTAYCTADAYRLKATSKFLKEVHGARTKLYDECLYVAYHLPLLPGSAGYRVRSSPAVKNPGGQPALDVEIERSEQTNYHEGYFDSYDGKTDDRDEHAREQRRQSEEHEHQERPTSPRDSERMDMNAVAEMFIFSYGVVVFWNFTERQEKEVLADLAFSEDKGMQLISGPMSEDDFESEEFNFEYSSKTRSPRVNYAPGSVEVNH